MMGVHLGLHYEWLIKRTSIRKLSVWVRRVSAVVISLVILGFGVYEMTATEFAHWMNNLGVVVGSSSALPEDGHEDALLPEGDHGDEALADGEQPEEVHERGGGQGKGLGKGAGALAAETEVDLAALDDVLLGFFSILLSFSVATAWIDGILLYRKKHKLLKQSHAA